MKRIIKVYLKRKLDRSRSFVNKYRLYLFLRLLAEFCKDKEDSEDVIYLISRYISNEYPRLSRMFTDIFVIDDQVYIFTEYPGFWTGKGGSTLNAIKDAININGDGVKYRDYEVTPIEDWSSPIYDVHRWMSFFNSEI